MKKQEEVKKQVDLIVRRAVKVKVMDQKSLSAAEGLIVQVKDFIKGVIEYFEDPIKKAHAAHKAILAKKNEALDPLLKAEKFLKNAVKDYLVEEERARRAAEEQRKFEQEALLAKLEKERDEGDTKAADETFEKIEEIHEKSMKIEEAPQMTGVTKKTLIRWRVTDIDLVPRDLLMIDKAEVDEIVKRLKMNASIPGIEIYEDLIVAMKRS